jgi:hypothetical protein
MITRESIESGLAAHALWKKRLLEAIEKGRSDFQVATVRKDNACDFGKWLHGLPAEDRSGEDFRKVLELHAEFHRAAGDILALAVEGKKEEARKQLEYGGAYGHVSGKLILAMNGWKEKIPGGAAGKAPGQTAGR